MKVVKEDIIKVLSKAERTRSKIKLGETHLWRNFIIMGLRNFLDFDWLDVSKKRLALVDPIANP